MIGHIEHQHETQLKQIIQQLTCPLTQQIMNDPVIIETGHTFDRHLIMRWFERGNITNPVTGLPLNSINLYPNICAKNIISKIPTISERIKKSHQDYEHLLIALEQMWNNQTPNNVELIRQESKKLANENSQLKQQIKSKEMELETGKYSFKVQLDKVQQKLKISERTNKYIKNILKNQTNLKNFLQNQNEKLKKQIQELKNQINGNGNGNRKQLRNQMMMINSKQMPQQQNNKSNKPYYPPINPVRNKRIISQYKQGGNVDNAESVDRKKKQRNQNLINPNIIDIIELPPFKQKNKTKPRPQSSYVPKQRRY